MNGFFWAAVALRWAARQKKPENTLVIESGEGFGGEFVDALRADSCAIVRPEGEARRFMTSSSRAAFLMMKAPHREEFICRP